MFIRNKMRHVIHIEIPVLFSGVNSCLKAGLESLLNHKLQSDNQANSVPEGGGLLLLAPQGCTTEHKVRMLSLVQSLRFTEGWKGLVLTDKNDTVTQNFSNLMGLPLVDLNLSVVTLWESITTCMKYKQKIRRDSIGRMTKKQWIVLHESLDENACSGEKRKPLFYAHRQLALARIKLQNIHQLRVMLTSPNCETGLND